MTVGYARIDGRVRLVTTLAVSVSIAALGPRSWRALCVMGAWVVATTFLARPRPGWWLRRFAVAVLWGVLSAWARTLWTTPRALLALDVGARVTLALAATLPLAWTMTPTQLAETLGRLRLPAPLVAISTSMARGLSTLSEEATRIVRARRLRAPHAGLFTRAAMVGTVSGAVFSRGIARAERMQQAMELRGFDGTLPPGSATTLRAADLAWLFVTASVTVGAHVLP